MSNFAGTTSDLPHGFEYVTLSSDPRKQTQPSFSWSKNDTVGFCFNCVARRDHCCFQVPCNRDLGLSALKHCQQTPPSTASRQDRHGARQMVREKLLLGR